MKRQIYSTPTGWFTGSSYISRLYGIELYPINPTFLFKMAFAFV